jgi:hypothetical protein
MYLAVPITSHFEKIIRLIMKKEEMFLSNIKFKNFYVIDLDTDEVLFDMQDLNVICTKNRVNPNINIFLKMNYYGKS